MTRNAIAADAAGAAIPVLAGGLAAWLAGVDPVAAALGLGFGIAVVAATVGPGRLSGAHLAPALSLGLWLTGRVDGRGFAGHLAAQGAGLAAALALTAPM